VNVRQSYMSGGQILLYVFNAAGMAFAKATPDELRPLVINKVE